MRPALEFGPVLFVWAAVVYRLPTLRRSSGTSTTRAYFATLLALATSLTILLPPVYLAVDEISSIPNLARLLGHESMLVAAWAVQRFLLHLNYPQATARH